MQGGTAATQEVFIEHVGIPTLAAIPPAVRALQDLGMHRKVQLIVSGGVRNGADVAKCLALGADAVSIGTAALIAIGDNDPQYENEYRKLGTTAGAYDDWHEGRDPAGITTQDEALARRLDPVTAGRKLANYLAVLTLETQTIARACGKSHVHNLEPEDLVALTVEAAAMARVPLAGTDWIPGLKEQDLKTRGNTITRGPGRDEQGERARFMASLSAFAKEERDQIFSRLVRRSVRHDAREDRAGHGDRYDREVRSRLCRLRRLVRHDAGPSGHPGDGGADSAIQLPWKPEVAWVTGDLIMDGKPVAQNPRQVLKRVVDQGRGGKAMS